MIEKIAVFLFAAYMVYFFWYTPKYLKEIADALKILTVMKYKETDDAKKG